MLRLNDPVALIPEHGDLDRGTDLLDGRPVEFDHPDCEIAGELQIDSFDVVGDVENGSHKKCPARGGAKGLCIKRP